MWPTLLRRVDVPQSSTRKAAQTVFHPSPDPRPKALAALRLSCLTKATTSPHRQRSVIRLRAEELGLTVFAEACDLGVSARRSSPFDRPALSAWLQQPQFYEAVIWSHVDRAVRSVSHMERLIAWGADNARTLVFAMPESERPLVVAPDAAASVVRRCLALAHDAEREAQVLSDRLSHSHMYLRMNGRYGGGLVPFGFRKAPHPSGSGWSLIPDPETAPLVRWIVAEVQAGRSLTSLARELNEQAVPVPRDRHAQLQGRPTGGHRHGRDFDRFRWTAGTLSKVLRSPSLTGHRVHAGKTVRDASGAPVLVGQPLLTEHEFAAVRTTLAARSRGTRGPRRRTTALLTGIVRCAGCDGRMYFAARKGHEQGDYVCRAASRGEVCPRAGGMRSDWLEAYTLDRYREATGQRAQVTREDLLRDGVLVTVAKGRSGGGPARTLGPDVSRLRFTMRTSQPDDQPES
ncbi:recombinase family protein [Streptomyces longwoodensis]|uniref:recombinase family protein n=1 Tax=Streptomyces longwoodensis TaxID=68231 RepID=UPI002E7FF2B8|nr:recombinase family protein [Streptomyces longwoodensis]WUC59381.1 recombinase family protein [Streptomyces longwoodensis]